MNILVHTSFHTQLTLKTSCIGKQSRAIDQPTADLMRAWFLEIGPLICMIQGLCSMVPVTLCSHGSSVLFIFSKITNHMLPAMASSIRLWLLSPPRLQHHL